MGFWERGKCPKHGPEGRYFKFFLTEPFPTNGHTAAVELLLAAGADKDAKNKVRD